MIDFNKPIELVKPKGFRWPVTRVGPACSGELYGYCRQLVVMDNGSGYFQHLTCDSFGNVWDHLNRLKKSRIENEESKKRYKIFYYDTCCEGVESYFYTETLTSVKNHFKTKAPYNEHLVMIVDTETNEIVYAV